MRKNSIIYSNGIEIVFLNRNGHKDKTRVGLVWTPPGSAFEGGRGSSVTFVATVVRDHNFAKGESMWWEGITSLIVDLD